MNRSVNFLISGIAHLPYVAVALNTLRRHYDGPVTVHAYPESIALVTRIAADERLSVEARLWEPVYKGKNGQFFNKLHMMQSLDPEANLYLDADLIINGSLDYLFLLLEETGFIATQFGDWVSNGGLIRKRISNLLQYPAISPVSVQFAMDNPLPSVNGGVFGCLPDSPVLETWKQWTEMTLSEFICDEVCLHAITALYYELDNFAVATGGRWNCSPKHKPAHFSDDDISIWHFHGDSNVRPDKCPNGVDLWMKEFSTCLEENTGGINQWLGQAVAQNKHMKELGVTSNT